MIAMAPSCGSSCMTRATTRRVRCSAPLGNGVSRWHSTVTLQHQHAGRRIPRKPIFFSCLTTAPAICIWPPRTSTKGLPCLKVTIFIPQSYGITKKNTEMRRTLIPSSNRLSATYHTSAGARAWTTSSSFPTRALLSTLPTHSPPGETTFPIQSCSQQRPSHQAVAPAVFLLGRMLPSQATSIGTVFKPSVPTIARLLTGHCSLTFMAGFLSTMATMRTIQCDRPSCVSLLALT
mmetsp:Transcript_52474/g.101374  ORF Transcript_52474/g.101374 Transcript_52474/m.101374 type:complete len:234 (+) Transcript_52474:432-1133(+)